MEKNKKIVVFGAVLSLLVAASLFVYTVYASNMLSYLSNDPKACINCHVMNSAFASWEKSSHKNVAGCVDCHLPVDSFLAKYTSKAKDGWNHSVAFSTNSYEQSLLITEDGANRVQANCIRCHTSTNETLRMNADKYHSGEDGSLKSSRKCWECHQYVPHGKGNSLIAAPFSLGVKERIK